MGESRKRVVMAVDQGGFVLKKIILPYLESRGYEVEDLGVFDENSVDYPDMADKACREYLRGDYTFGILACGTGIGISITANKFPGIRCALPQNSFAARMAKEHNNANFIAFGGRIDYQEPVEKMLGEYIDASWSEEERHRNRVAKIDSHDMPRSR